MSKSDAKQSVEHPEEMTTDVELRLGDMASIHVRTRVTPAGLVCAAILASSVLLSVGWLIRCRASGTGGASG